MISSAIILAGGRGSRLAPWPAPKCILPLNGVSLIEHLLTHLEASAIPRAIVCTGYRASAVEAAVRGRRGALPVEFSNAGEDAEMGARLLQARDEHHVAGRCLILYGDEIADVDLAALVEHHDRAGTLCTFTAYEQRIPFGVIRQGYILGDETVLVNIGFAIIEEPAWGLLHPEDGLSDWINRVNAATRSPSVYLHEGRRATVNSVAELQQAERLWAS